MKRLREFFSRRKVTIGASGLAVLISANAVQSAPVGLAAAISTAVVLTGTAVSTSTAVAATKVIAMTTLQKTLVTATVAVLAGAGIFEARQASQLHEQVQILQQEQAPLAEQIRHLQRERDDATNQIAGLEAENAQLQADQNETELLKLRSDSQELAFLKAAASARTNDPAEIAMRDWVARAKRLSQLIEQRPDLQIPEFKFLTPSDFLDVAKGVSLKTDGDVRIFE